MADTESSDSQKKSNHLGALRTFLKPQSTPIIAILLLFLATFAIVFFLGGGIGGAIPGTNAENQSPNPSANASPSSGGGTELIPPPTLDDFLTLFEVESCPTDGYGSKSGCIDLSKTDPKTQFAYDTLSVPLQSQTYKTLLTTAGKIEVRLRPRPPTCSGNPVPAGGTCGGAGYGPNTLELGGYYEAGSGLRVKESIIHETGHLIQQRNPTVFGIGGSKEMPIAQLAQEDTSCYTPTNPSKGQYYINTYANKTNGVGGGFYNETFAETIGMNAYAGPGISYDKALSCTSSNTPNCSKTITSYPTTCPKTYDWVKQSVYGGSDFFGIGATPAPSNSAQANSSSSGCGQKSNAPTGPASGWSCTSSWATDPVKDGYYTRTTFGCNTGFTNQDYKDYLNDHSTGDNCLPGCGNSFPECSGGKTGKDCEEAVAWYSANAGQFKCGNKIKVTNPSTGKAVVLRVIDYGPACYYKENPIQEGRGKIDVSQMAGKELSYPNIVQVEKAPDSAPLGPLPTCSQ